jgi:hypothetical protein
MPNTFPSSVLNLGTLSEATAPSLLDIRNAVAGLQGRDAHILTQAFEQIQTSIDNLQQTLRSASPSLQFLEIDSADITRLCVGGEFDPGQLLVLGGPPSYAAAGWIGTALNASPVTITSITAGTATTAVDHNLKPNAAVLVEGAGANDGYFIIDTVPTPTTFTVLGAFPVNTTGGTMTRLFQGGWLAQFACGGTAFDDAPLQVDVDGTLSITDALITLSATSGGVTNTITLDPDQVEISVASFDAISGGTEVLLESGRIRILTLDTAGAVDVDGSETTLEAGRETSFAVGLTTLPLSKVFDVNGYTATTAYGPVLSFTQWRGTPTSTSATQSGDTLGGFYAQGTNGSATSGGASVVAVATAANAATTAIRLTTDRVGVGSVTTPLESLHTSGHVLLGLGNDYPHQLMMAGSAAGSEYSVFEATDSTHLKINVGAWTYVVVAAGNFGVGVANPAYAVDVSGDVNASGVLRVAGTQVVSTRKTKPTQTTKTAGAAYGANEQAMMNELKTFQDQLNAALSAAAGGHGLWA